MSRQRVVRRSFLAQLWNTILGGAEKASPLPRRALRVEGLESRCLMDSTLANITGTIYRDANGNNAYNPGEVGVANVQVQLYRDNGNGVFGANDTLVTSTTTSATGSYSFTNQTQGVYFVRRPAQTLSAGPQAGIKLTEKVSDAIHAEALKTVIDDFNSPANQTAAIDFTPNNTPATSIASGLTTANTLGGEREIIVNFTGTTNNPAKTISGLVLTNQVAGAPRGELQLDADSDAKGTYTLVWDGADGVASTNPNLNPGLGVTDLTANGAKELRVESISVDRPGATVNLTVYTDATHFSTASLPLLQAQTEYAFAFNGSGAGGFATGTGAVGGADFTKVRAVTMVIDAQQTDAIDSKFDRVAAFGSPDATANLAVDEVDLSITKIVDNATPLVGSIVNFVVTVTNATTLPNGKATVQATGVTVTDTNLIDTTVKDKLTYVSDNTGGAFNSASGVWTVGNLDPGQSKTMIISFRVNATAMPRATNTVRVTSVEQPDPDTDDWIATRDVNPKILDIGVTKQVSVAKPDMNQTISFTVTAKNNGTADATNVKIEDVLSAPSMASFQLTGSTPGGSSSYNATTGLWTIPSLVVGASVQLVLTGKVIDCDPMTNTARLISIGNGTDSNSANDSATVVSTPKEVDLGIVKQVVSTGGRPANTTPSAANPTVAYQLTVTNTGPDGATGVVVNDVIPANLTFVSASSTGYNATTGVWNVGAVAMGATRTLTIIARLNAGVTASTITNTATVSTPNQCDDNTTNDSSTVVVNPQIIDLSVTKTVDNASPLVGDNVAWTITVTNAGPSVATGVALKDVLPAGVSFVSSVPAKGSFNGNNGVWTVGTLAVGETTNLKVTTKVTAGGTQTNVVEVSAADQTDIDSTPNNGLVEDDRATASINAAAPRIDLSVTKTVSNASPQLGDNVTWTITVRNDGPQTATGVSLKDTLPAGVSFVSATPVKGTFNPNTSVWNVGALNDNESTTLQVVTRVNSTDLQVNHVEVITADQTDIDSTPNNGFNSEDDHAFASVTAIAQRIDLSVTKTVNDQSPLLGDNVTWTITVRNDGPQTATGVSLKDTLPAGVSFVSASPAKGSFNSNTGIWTVGTLNDNESTTLQVVTRVNSTDLQVNHVEVFSADQTDIDSTPNNGINSEDDHAAASVVAAPPVIDLSVTKTVNQPTVTLGTNAVFQITVTNSGPFTATGVTVRELIPTGLAYVTAATAKGGYSPVTGIWTVGTLAVGETATLSVTMRVDTLGITTNIAEVAAADQTDIDSTPSNNDPTEDDRATANVNGVPQTIDLSVTKTVNNATPQLNSLVTFLVSVTNSGPFTATGVVLQDLVPAGVSFQSTSASKGAYSPVTGLWTLGTLGVNETATMQVTVRVNSLGIKTNVVEVFRADQPDIDSTPGNGLLEDDRASASLTPIGSPDPQGNPDPPLHSKQSFLAR